MKICVLGAGVIGVTTAYMLARDGYDVTIIEWLCENVRILKYASGD